LLKVRLSVAASKGGVAFSDRPVIPKWGCDLLNTLADPIQELRRPTIADLPALDPSINIIIDPILEIGFPVAVVVSRNEAFNEAKRDAGIPTTQSPDRVEHVPMTDRSGRVVQDSRGNVVLTREYHFTNSRGESIIIQDHGFGHPDFGLGPHFNVRPASNPRTGSVQGTQGHYQFPR